MKFCFIVPYYSEQSNGIRVLYQAALLFSEHSERTSIKVYSYETGKTITNPNLDIIPSKFHHLISNESKFSIDDIYILPETPSKKPRNLPRRANIIRYLLANPFLFNKEKINLKNQFLLSYSYAISERLPQLFIEALPNLKKQIKKNNNKKLLVYFGKFRLNQSFENIIHLNKIIESYSQVEIIHRGFPKKHEEYLIKLNSADCLISYDGFTCVSYEASLMGIPVVVVDDLHVKEKFNVKLNNIFTINEFTTVKKSIYRIKEPSENSRTPTKANLKNLFILINDFFTKKNKKLGNLFEQEMKNMELFAKKNYNHNILNFNYDLKLIFLLLFLFNHEAYSRITESLNKIEFKAFKILLGPFFIIFYLRFRCLNFCLIAIKFLFLYKFRPKSFILIINKYISTKESKI